MKTLLIILFFLLLAGCSSMRTVDLASENSPEQTIEQTQIEVGDEVLVLTKNGKTYEFTVNSANSKVISGNEIKILISEIKEIKKKEFSILKSVGLVPITWIGLTLIVLVII